MDWRSRIVISGDDRDEWIKARERYICASDAKMFAKLESVDKYVASLIAPKKFFGNDLTESGHRWEPMILAYLGVPENKALIAASEHPGLACTPDGISEGDPFTIAECKTRHGSIKPNPDAGEWRQLAHQFRCVPEAELVLFGTLTLVRGENGEWEARKGGYTRLEIPRDHPKIVAAMETIVPITDRVLAAVTAARKALKGAPF